MSDNRLYACFGEMLLRLNAPGRERLLQTGRLDVHFGGAEANVAASLAQFGRRARMISIVPDSQIGEAAVASLRRYGVETDRIRRMRGRMGLYFMSAGAVRRPSEIIYDRAASAFASASPGAIDWRDALDGAASFHVSGISPAVSASAAEATLAAVRAASASGIEVSFDGNYRAQLWAAWRGDGPKILREILSCASIAFIDERDIALVLGREFKGDKARSDALAAVFDAFPKLSLIAHTSRKVESVDRHVCYGTIVSRSGEWRSRESALEGVVDRIGAGDAFAAGVLHALHAGKDNQYAIDFAVAAFAFKHSIPGDINIANAADIEAAMGSDSLDVRR